MWFAHILKFTIVGAPSNVLQAVVSSFIFLRLVSFRCTPFLGAWITVMSILFQHKKMRLNTGRERSGSSKLLGFFLCGRQNQSWGNTEFLKFGLRERLDHAWVEGRLDHGMGWPSQTVSLSEAPQNLKTCENDIENGKWYPMILIQCFNYLKQI